MPFWDSLFKPDIKKLESKRDIESLIKLLKYREDSRVCKGAAEALGRLKDTRAVEPLIAALQDGPSNEAAESLGAIGDARAVEPLIAIVNRQQGQPAPILALGQLGDARAVPAILQLITNRDTRIREAAAEALGKLRSSDVIEPLVKAYWEETRYFKGAQRVAKALLEKTVNSDSDRDKDRALAAIKELRSYGSNISYRTAYELVINRLESQSELYDLADCVDSGHLNDYIRSLLRYLFPQDTLHGGNYPGLERNSPVERINDLLTGRLADKVTGVYPLDHVRPVFETSLKKLLATLDLESYYSQTISRTISGKCAKCEKQSGTYRCTRCNRAFCEACITGFGYEAAQILIEHMLGKSEMTFGTAKIFDEQGRAFCPHCYGILLLKSRLTGDWTVQNDEQRDPTCIPSQR